jgi:hypothetical protein
MLTTIGDKILEIRPKQVIESDIIIDNDYLVLIESKKPKAPKVKQPKVEKNNEPTK